MEETMLCMAKAEAEYVKLFGTTNNRNV